MADWSGNGDWAANGDWAGVAKGQVARTSAEAITQADSDQRDAQTARTSVEAITQADSDQRDAQVARVSVEVITKATNTVAVDHTFDAIAKAIGTEVDHTFDAIAKAVDVEKDHTFDAIAQAVDVEVDHTFDAIGKALDVAVDHTFDAIAQDVDIEVDHTFDGIAKAVDIAVDHTFDAITFGAALLDHSFDAIAKAVDVEVDHTFDAIANTETALDHTFDAIAKAVVPIDHTFDAVAKAVNVEVDHTFDAIAQTTDIEVDHTFDAIAQAVDVEVDHTFDAIAKAVVAVDHTFDAITSGSVNLDHTFDAILQATDIEVDHTFDAVTAFPVAELDHTFDARVTQGWKLIKTYTRTGTEENPTGFYGLTWGMDRELQWIEKVGSNHKYFWNDLGLPPQDMWDKDTDFGLEYNVMAADDRWDAPGAQYDTWGALNLNLEVSGGSYESVFQDSTGDLHKFSFRGDQRTIGHQFLDSADVGDNESSFAWTSWDVDHQTWSTSARYIAAFDMAQDGDTVHLVTLEINHDASSANVFRYYYYKGSLTTQSWSVSAETVNTISQPSGQSGMPALTSAIDWPRIAVRSDDYIAVLHVGTPTIRTGSTYDRNLAISVRNTSGTWTLYDGWCTAGNYSVQTNPADLVYGASDRLHVYWDEYDWTNSQYRKMHQSMTTTGTKDTATAYTTLGATPHSPKKGKAQAYNADGWKCQYYYDQIDDGRYKVYVIEHVSEANPTISADTFINTSSGTDYNVLLTDQDNIGLWDVTRIGGYNYLIGYTYDTSSPLGYTYLWWCVWMQSTHGSGWSAPLIWLRNNKLAADGGTVEGNDDHYKWPAPTNATRWVGAGSWTRSNTNYIWISHALVWYEHGNLYQIEAPQVPSIAVDHTFDAIAQALKIEVDHTFDAVLASTTEFALDFTFDAIVFDEVALDHTFDANTIFVREIDHTFDAILRKIHVISANMDITLNALPAAAKERSEIIGLGPIPPGSARGAPTTSQGRSPFGLRIYRPTRRIIREEKDE